MRLTILFLIVSVCAFGQEKSALDFKITSAFNYLYHAKSKDMVNIQEEIWKSVTGYEGYYEVSNQGRVRSLPRKFSPVLNELKMSLDKDGYVIAKFHKDGVGSKHKVHRLVAIHFIDNPENKPFVNHIKGVKSDNRASELEWSTQSENAKHAIQTGLMSMDHLIAIRKTKVGILNKLSKEVHQYSLDGVYIRSFFSATEAKKVTKASCISAVALSKRSKSGGFKWSYTKLES